MRKLLFIIPFFALSISTQAQVIDDSALEDLHNKGVRFVEGMFVAYLADTVSPTFIRNSFAEQKIRILNIDIEPVVIRLVNTPSDSTLQALQSLPNTNIYQPRLTTTEHDFLETNSTLKTLINENNDTLRSINTDYVDSIFIEFDYSINQEKLRALLRPFDDLAYVIFRDTPRTVTLEAEAGNEFELMDKVQQLTFVSSTTLIGQIDY